MQDFTRHWTGRKVGRAFREDVRLLRAGGFQRERSAAAVLAAAATATREAAAVASVAAAAGIGRRNTGRANAGPPKPDDSAGRATGSSAGLHANLPEHQPYNTQNLDQWQPGLSRMAELQQGVLRPGKQQHAGPVQGQQQHNKLRVGRQQPRPATHDQQQQQYALPYNAQQQVWPSLHVNQRAPAQVGSQVDLQSRLVKGLHAQPAFYVWYGKLLHKHEPGVAVCMQQKLSW